MDALRQYLVPYLISNLLSGLCIAASLKKPLLSRMVLSLVFLWAAWVNAGFAIRNPAIYLEYRDLTPIPFYREFIEDAFSRHIREIVISIAFSQFLIFAGMLMKGNIVKLACLAGMIFGLAIAPLGIGAAFPATVMMAISFFILFRKDDHDYIWHWKQYSKQAREKSKNNLVIVS